MRPYTMEVRSNIGTRLASLTQWSAAVLEKTINRSTSIVLDYPVDGELNSLLDFPNQIYLYENGVFQGRFRVYLRVASDDLLRVTAYDPLHQLGREIVTYEAVDKPADEIIDDLLALQQISYRVQIESGNVAYTYPVSVNLVNQSILEGVRRLHAQLGGFYWVDETNDFHWQTQISSKPTQRISHMKNMGRITVTKDARNVRTSITVFGSGATPDTRIEASATHNTGTYGTIPWVESYPEINSVEELQAIADKRILELSEPRRFVQIDAIDLSHLAGRLDFSDDSLDLGSRVIIVSPRHDLEYSTRIIRIVRDLSSPVLVQIEVEDDTNEEVSGLVRRDFIDMFIDLVNGFRTFSERDWGALDDSVIEGFIERLIDNSPAWTTLIDALEPFIGGEGAGLSDNTPEPCGVQGISGVGTLASRDDHVHEIRLQAWPGT